MAEPWGRGIRILGEKRVTGLNVLSQLHEGPLVAPSVPSPISHSVTLSRRNIALEPEGPGSVCFSYPPPPFLSPLYISYLLSISTMLGLLLAAGNEM